MNGTALDLKEYAEQKDLINRYGRQDIIYVMLDKRIDDLKYDVKELKGEMKEIRSDIKDLQGGMKELDSKVVNTQADIKVLDNKIEGILDSIKQGKTLNKWIFGMLVTILLGLGGLAAAVLL